MTIFTYATYNFRNKDPEIDVMRTRVQDIARRTGLTFEQVVHRACDISRVSYSTVDAWFNGATRKPQSATLKAFGIALGGKFSWNWGRWKG